MIVGAFPARDQIGTGTVIHVSIYMFLLNLLETFTMVCTFAFVLPITDTRISGIHVTFMACLCNLTQYLHKLYVFRLVDAFGIFTP